MTEPTQEKEDLLLQALLREYDNAVQLYTNTIAVTYTRIYGLLAVHGAITVGFFLVSGQWQFAISILGFILAIFTFLTVEHVWQFSSFRITQAKEIEMLLNKLIKADDKFKLTTFHKQMTLFRKGIKKEEVKFNLTDESLPKDRWGTWLINNIPYQADRLITWFIVGWWIFLIILSRLN